MEKILMEKEELAVKLGAIVPISMTPQDELDFRSSTHCSICKKALKGLEGGGGQITAGESSKSSDMLYSKASSSDAEEELISASASDSRDCKIFFSNGGRTAIGKTSMSTEVGLVVGRGFNVD
ncbi:hypothetical protein AVEN_63602-1 [Araneus ventricosus]|uniref:Uncharacterized protein n=1 Tax=Araneus ventricosus TaxID=182803 RepID=A0A4Y2SPB4_ARAVE|nr:hypothetical protein AVEN_63602-1 [Araneus ventricosus]